MAPTTKQSLTDSASSDTAKGRVVILAILVIGVATLLLYQPSFAWLLAEWLSGNALIGHGLLLAAVSAYLLVRALGRMRVDSIAPCWWALPVVLSLSIAWMLGHVAGAVVVETSVLPLLLLGAILTVFGRSIVEQLGFAVLYLFFALPVWEHLRGIFQDLTVLVVHFLIRIAGIPALIDGERIHVAAGTFGIAKGCSGINIIVISLALAALYGHIYYKTQKARWILLASAFGLALLSNWIRVTTIIVVGNATDMQSSLVDDHTTFGWVLFGLTLLPLFLIAQKLEGPYASSTSQPKPGVSSHGPVRAWPATIAVLGAMAVGPVWAGVMINRDSSQDLAILELPEFAGDWNGPTESHATWRPYFLGASDEAIAEYNSARGSVWLYSNVYLSQEQDRELVYLHNKVAGDFLIEAAKTISVRMDESGSREVREIVSRDGGIRWRIWYWYEIDGTRETSESTAKLLQAMAILRGRPEAGIVAIATTCDADCAQAGSRMESFIRSIGDGPSLHYSVAGRSTER